MDIIKTGFNFSLVASIYTAITSSFSILSSAFTIVKSILSPFILCINNNLIMKFILSCIIVCLGLFAKAQEKLDYGEVKNDSNLIARKA